MCSDLYERVFKEAIVRKLLLNVFTFITNHKYWQLQFHPHTKTVHQKHPMILINNLMVGLLSRWKIQ